MKLYISALLLCLGSLAAYGQEEKMNANLQDYHFNFSADDNWRLITYAELQKENPASTAFLFDPDLKAVLCLMRKDGKKITDYPYVVVQIMEVPAGTYSVSRLKEDADSIFTLSSYLRQIDSLKEPRSEVFNSLTNSKNYFDAEKVAMVSKSEGSDEVNKPLLVYSQTFFSLDHMANIKIYTHTADEEKYMPDFMNMLQNAHFDEAYILK